MNPLVAEAMRLADAYASEKYRDAYQFGTMNDKTLAARAALLAHLQKMGEDAERYRWLRMQHWEEAEIACVAHPKNSVKLGYDCPSLERLDAAIDAAKGKEP